MRINVKLGGGKRKEEGRTMNDFYFVKLGDAIGATLSTNLHPSGRKKKTARVIHLFFEVLRRDPPVSLTRKALRNPLCICNRPSWPVQKDLSASTNILFRRHWKSQGDLFVCMMTVQLYVARARQPTWCVSNGWAIEIRICGKWDF